MAEVEMPASLSMAEVEAGVYGVKGQFGLESFNLEIDFSIPKERRY